MKIKVAENHNVIIYNCEDKAIWLTIKEAEQLLKYLPEIITEARNNFKMAKETEILKLQNQLKELNLS